MLEALGKQLKKPSGTFGKIVSRMMNMRNKASYKKMLNELDIQKGDKLYEIGYGPGKGIHRIANRWSDCTIHGIDFSELMYQTATHRNKKFIESGRVNLKYGDIISENVTHESYDKIFCLNVVYFWNDLRLVFRKIYSLLNHGGTYFIFMMPANFLADKGFTADFNKYSIEEVTSALKEVGFKQVEYKLDKGYYIKSKK